MRDTQMHSNPPPNAHVPSPSLKRGTPCGNPLGHLWLKDVCRNCFCPVESHLQPPQPQSQQQLSTNQQPRRGSSVGSPKASPKLSKVSISINNSPKNGRTFDSLNNNSNSNHKNSNQPPASPQLKKQKQKQSTDSPVGLKRRPQSVFVPESTLVVETRNAAKAVNRSPQPPKKSAASLSPRVASLRSSNRSSSKSPTTGSKTSSKEKEKKPSRKSNAEKAKESKVRFSSFSKSPNAPRVSTTVEEAKSASTTSVVRFPPPSATSQAEAPQYTIETLRQRILFFNEASNQIIQNNDNAAPSTTPTSAEKKEVPTTATATASTTVTTVTSTPTANTSTTSVISTTTASTNAPVVTPIPIPAKTPETKAPSQGSKESPREGSGSPENACKKRNRIVAELVATEKSYVTMLSDLIENFMKPIQAAKCIPEDTVKLIFRNVQSLLVLHSELLANLTARLDSWSPSQTIGDVLLKTIPYLKMYVTYVNTFDQSQKVLHQILQENQKIAAVIDGCKAGQYAGRLGLGTLRVVPIQRIPRYLLLLKELKEATPEEHSDTANVREALLAISDMAQYIENSKKQFDMLQKMAQLKQGLGADSLKAFQDSMMTMKDAKKTHNFEKRVASCATKCWFCDKAIPSNNSIRKCSKCGIEAHKGCKKLIQHNCGQSEMKEHRIPLQSGEATYRKLQSGSGTSRSKAKNVTVFLFYDSVVIASSKGSQTASKSKRGEEKMANEQYDFVVVLKWYSNKSKKKMDVLSAEGNNMLSLIDPRSNEAHLLTFHSPTVCQEWYNEVVSAKQKWFEKEYSQSDLKSQYQLNHMKPSQSISHLHTADKAAASRASNIIISSEQESKKIKRKSLSMGMLATSQSAPIVTKNKR